MTRPIGWPSSPVMRRPVPAESMKLPSLQRNRILGYRTISVLMLLLISAISGSSSAEMKSARDRPSSSSGSQPVTSVIEGETHS